MVGHFRGWPGPRIHLVTSGPQKAAGRIFEPTGRVSGHKLGDAEGWGAPEVFPHGYERTSGSKKQSGPQTMEVGRRGKKTGRFARRNNCFFQAVVNGMQPFQKVRMYYGP